MRFSNCNLSIMLILSVMSLCSTLNAQETETDPPTFYQLHIKDGFTVEVSVEAGETGPEGYYELLISRGDEQAARLEGRRQGYLEESWMSDLNGDGQFEVVTVERLHDRDEQALIRIHEWTDNIYLLPIKLKTPNAKQLTGYRGFDTYRIEDDTLIRQFPRFKTKDHIDKPRGGQTVLRYDFEQARWVSVETDSSLLDKLPLIDKLPFIGDD